MTLGRTDRGYNTLAHTCKNRILAGTTDKTLDVGTHCNTRNGNELDTVLCHSCNVRCINNLWVYRHLHSLKHVATGKVNGCSHLECKFYIRLRCRNKCMHHPLDVTARKIMRLKTVASNILQTRLMSLNHRLNDDTGRYITDAHKKELQQRNPNSRHLGRQPKHKRDIMEKEHQQDNGSKRYSCNQIDVVRIHNYTVLFSYTIIYHLLVQQTQHRR